MTIQLEGDAWHEAGHVAIGLRLGQILDFVTVMPTEISEGMYKGNQARALTMWGGHRNSNGPQVRCPLVDILAQDLAGGYVELAVFPDHDSSWVGDMRVMALSCWKALASWGETPDVSDENMFELIRIGQLPPAVLELIDNQENLALDKLKAMFSSDPNLWSDVRRVAEALIERKTLSGAEVNAIISRNTGRNAPCPCGSGKKYKKCHGERT